MLGSRVTPIKQRCGGDKRNGNSANITFAVSGNRANITLLVVK